MLWALFSRTSASSISGISTSARQCYKHQCHQCQCYQHQWSYGYFMLFCRELEYVIIYAFLVQIFRAKFVSVLFKSLFASLLYDRAVHSNWFQVIDMSVFFVETIDTELMMNIWLKNKYISVQFQVECWSGNKIIYQNLVGCGNIAVKSIMFLGSKKLLEICKQAHSDCYNISLTMERRYLPISW